MKLILTSYLLELFDRREATSDFIHIPYWFLLSQYERVRLNMLILIASRQFVTPPQLLLLNVSEIFLKWSVSWCFYISCVRGYVLATFMSANCLSTFSKRHTRMSFMQSSKNSISHVKRTKCCFLSHNHVQRIVNKNE